MLQTAATAVLDECWVLEAQREEELPERVLCKCRWNYCDPTLAYLDVDDAGNVVKKN